MSSIFDLSGQTPKKKAPAPPKSQTPAVALSGESVRAMLEKIKTLNEDLALQLESTEKKLGVGPDEIKQQMERLRDLAPNTFEQIKNRKIELEKQILGLTDQQLVRRKNDAASQKKKGKTLGARKGWIDMR